MYCGSHSDAPRWVCVRRLQLVGVIVLEPSINLSEHMAERARELDMLRFQIDEIEEAGLQIGEDEAIAEELKRLDSFDHIDKVLGSCYDAFYGGRHPLLDTVNAIKVEVNDLVKYDDEVKEISELVNSAYFQLINL